MEEISGDQGNSVIAAPYPEDLNSMSESK